MMLWHENTVQVNVPFRMLYEKYLDRFLNYKLNPEIGLDAYSLDNYKLSDFSSVAAELQKSALTVTFHAPFMDLSPGSPDTAVWELTRRRFKQMLELLPVFSPKAIVCHSGYDSKRYWNVKDVWIERSLEMWAWLAAGLGETETKIMIENVYEHDPEDMHVLFKRLEGQGIRFCLDIGHQNAFSSSSLEKWVKILGPYIGQLPLHDNDGSQDSHLALGQGNINLPDLFRLLNTAVVEPVLITLEPHEEEALWPSIEYLRHVRSNSM
jgi:sugar phosphate isomerase/epimerase